MSQWEFGSDEEMQQAAKQTRQKPPWTARRIGELIGGTMGALLGIAIDGVLIFTTRDFSPLTWIAIPVGGMLAGAAFGKVAFSIFGSGDSQA